MTSPVQFTGFWASGKYFALDTGPCCKGRKKYWCLLQRKKIRVSTSLCHWRSAALWLAVMCHKMCWPVPAVVDFGLKCDSLQLIKNLFLKLFNVHYKKNINKRRKAISHDSFSHLLSTDNIRNLEPCCFFPFVCKIQIRVELGRCKCFCNK